MEYAYFSGCITPQRENAYELATRSVLKKLNIGLIEMKDVSCCGFFLDAVDHISGAVLAARNLSIAEDMDLDILTLCPTCSSYLKKVRTEILEEGESGNKINKLLKEINREVKGKTEVKHLTQVLFEDIGLGAIEKTIVKPISNLRVAPHYGCHLLKPSDEIMFDDPEDPRKVDSLMEVTGIKLLDYAEKRLCCGAPVIGVDEKLSLGIVRQKLQSIKEANADAIVTVCPFCHLHLDLNQIRVEREYSEKYNIPAFHYTQLLGIAQGIDPDELGIYENRVSLDRIMESL